MRRSQDQWQIHPEDISRARTDAVWLLLNTRNIVLGTVGSDGNSHTTVLSKNFAMRSIGSAQDPILSFLFWSFAATRHALNIKQNPEQLLRLQFLRTDADYGAVALHGFGSRLEYEDIRKVLPGFNDRRARMEALPPRDLSEFTGPDNPKAMYQILLSDTAELPVQASDAEGNWVHDTFISVPLRGLVDFDLLTGID
jgi:hypothetical protein